MSDRVFLDTNIVIYAHTDHHLAKQKRAQQIISDENTIISTQVIQETANILHKKLKHPWSEVEVVLGDIILNSTIYTNTSETASKACFIASKYGFSFYDSLIISAALQCGVKRLYTEDMHHGQLIENQIVLINPFRG